MTKKTDRPAKGGVFPSRRALLLMSGGLDSTTLLALLVVQGYKVTTAFCDYGQPARHVERVRAQRNSAKYGAADHTEYAITSQLELQASGYFPARNLVIAAGAVAIAESRKLRHLFLGLVSTSHDPVPGPTYPDCSQEWVDALQQVVNWSTDAEIVVQAPLLDVQKPGVLGMARALGVDVDDTFSCLSPDEERPCGSCRSCRELAAAKRA